MLRLPRFANRFGFTLLRFRYTDEVLIKESLKLGIVTLLLQTTVSVFLPVDISFVP